MSEAKTLGLKIIFSFNKLQNFRDVNNKVVDYQNVPRKFEPLNIILPDRNDLPFLEIAVAGNIKILITGNKKHFPKNNYKYVKIFSPTEFIKEYDRLKQ